ncbi:MAG: bifunctional folylpolyglutamate synthase/dihydrofolate synthase [Gammaproteobacteria bacterium]|nr:bifunctional folylpolyglutamate synthase/dihydrofolate synthase [Gammaproteobacteria bacterium]
MPDISPEDRSLPDWLERIDQLHPNEIEMGLERVRRVAERLQVVRPASSSVIVAGTNGKGSTAVFTEALLIEMGYRVGTTLSPHVEHFNERVRIDGVAMDDATLCAHFEAVEAARGDIPLTYFEFATLVALLGFRNSEVDIAVLEVGLGGRLDAFNIVDADVAVITSIGLDHESYLGSDMEQIGREKAGVLRPDQRVVLGERVTASVCDRAAMLECEVARAGVDFTIARNPSGWAFRSPQLGLEDLPPGALAAENCAMAIAAAGFVAPDREPVSREVVLAALRRAWLPGRFETVECDGRRYLLDVAHNVAGAGFLREQLARRVARPVVAVFGSLQDKDSTGVLSTLEPLLEKVLCVSVEGARGLAAEELAARVPAGLAYETIPDLGAALARARSLTSPGDVILACGSFAVVGRARSQLMGS